MKSNEIRLTINYNSKKTNRKKSHKYELILYYFVNLINLQQTSSKNNTQAEKVLQGQKHYHLTLLKLLHQLSQLPTSRRSTMLQINLHKSAIVHI